MEVQPPAFFIRWFTGHRFCLYIRVTLQGRITYIYIYIIYHRGKRQNHRLKSAKRDRICDRSLVRVHPYREPTHFFHMLVRPCKVPGCQKTRDHHPQQPYLHISSEGQILIGWRKICDEPSGTMRCHRRWQKCVDFSL